MNRREFITLLGGAAAWPLTLRAEQSSRIARIGNLSTANPRSVPFYQAFERKLRDLGHIEGQNIVFEYRNAEGEVDRLPDLAAELVRLDASIIVTSTAAATSAVKRSTSTIPILMVAINYDPIALGYVDNLARPGGNVTGLFFQHLGLLAKRFGLLKELLPSISRVAVFSDSFTTDQLEVVHTANQSAGVELQPIHLQNPPYDFENVFRLAARSSAQAIMVLESAPIFRGRHQIALLAKEHRLPTSFAFREYVEVGGLFSYGVNFSAMYRRAARTPAARTDSWPDGQPTESSQLACSREVSSPRNPAAQLIGMPVHLGLPVLGIPLVHHGAVVEAPAFGCGARKRPGKLPGPRFRLRAELSSPCRPCRPCRQASRPPWLPW